MSLSEVVLTIASAVLLVVSLTIAGTFFYVWLRVRVRLALYLGLFSFGIAANALTLFITRWNEGFPCMPEWIVRIRLAGVIACTVLVLIAGTGIIKTLKPAQAASRNRSLGIS